MHVFRWWHKATTHADNVVNLDGYIRAQSEDEALDRVDRMLRSEFPTWKWMHRKQIEGNGVKFGPTVQKLKRKTIP